MSTFPLLIGGDPQHLALLDGCQLVLLGGSGDIIGETELPEVPTAVQFADSMLCVTHTDATEAVITSYGLDDLAPVATAILPGAWKPTGATCGRLILLHRDRLHITAVKVGKRALTPGQMALGLPTEIALPLDRPAVLVTKQLAFEIWDIIELRPSLRLGFGIPPAPRTMVAALGHAVVIHDGTDGLTLFRLSDGRPFRCNLGSPILQCLADVGSPYLILRTSDGLVRLHCFSHSMVAVNAPPAICYALLPNGDNTQLAGWAPGDAAPWRASLMGPAMERTATPVAAPAASAASSTPQLLTPAEVVSGASLPVELDLATNWRHRLMQVHNSNPASAQAYLTALTTDNVMLTWCTRSGCTSAAQALLTVLYARYLGGQPAIAIAEVATLLSSITDAENAWREALGTGLCGDNGLLWHQDGTVRLASVAGRYFDGAMIDAPSAAGSHPHAKLHGTHLLLDDRDSSAIDHDLQQRFGPTRWLVNYSSCDLLAHHLTGHVSVTRQLRPTLLDNPRLHMCVVVRRSEPDLPWSSLHRLTVRELRLT
jgi:hypothetical protein